MKYTIDIDGVLCENGNPNDYAHAIPKLREIASVQKLYKADNTICIFTSRLETDRQVTEQWLKKYNVPYHKLLFQKPTSDYYIDDKALDFIPDLNANVKRRKLAICFSGGMDSYIAYHWAIKELNYNPKDILCINFDIGHPYFKKEEQCLKQLEVPYTTMKIGLLSKKYNNMPDEVNYIIPGRNMIFASIAASFAKEVWIIGMKFENHYLMYDKNENFFRLATICLSQAIGSPTQVKSPFVNLTKTEIIKWSIKHKLPHLHETTSCYHPTLQRCGVCSLCFKRFIAMKACGLDENFINDPRKSKEAIRLREAYIKALADNDFSHYQKARILETLAIIGEN
jgi:7-cyano-7-deazaguanine synthase in queuosine biosynthesis